MEGANCKYCKTVIASRKKDLEDHSKTEKHKRNSVGSKSSKITEAFPKILDSHDAAVKKAEIRTALYVAEHGTNASVDHLGEVISALDPKSSILKDLKIHRTKCSGIINHILGPMVHEQLLADMKNSYFSLIIDESTDVSDKQCLGQCSSRAGLAHGPMGRAGPGLGWAYNLMISTGSGRAWAEKFQIFG